MSYEPRSVGAVIERIIPIIPDNEKDIREDIKNFYTRLWNKAPELLRGTELWLELHYILVKHIIELETPWKKEVIDIYTGKK
jgi:hypothetical protein